DNVTLPTWSTESAGTYAVQAKATDKAGNTFTGNAVTFTLLAPPALGSAATASDTNGNATLQVTNVSASVGRTVFVEIAMSPTSSSSNVTVTDSAGNTYRKDADVTNPVLSDGVRTLLFSARVTNALAGGTITTTYPAPIPQYKAVAVFSFDGLATPSPQDKSSTNIGSGADPQTLSSGATATTSQPDELLIGALGHGYGRATVFSPLGGFNAILSLGGGANGIGANGAAGVAMFP